MLPRATAAPHPAAVPRPSRRRLAALTVVASAACAAGVCALATASADEPVEPIVLRYTASPGCPDAADFGGEVRARTRRARAAEPGERARGFTVRIDRAGRAYRGRLEVREPDGGTTDREVSGVSCAEVASALALVTALAIDPQAVTAPRVVAADAGAAPSLFAADAGAPDAAVLPDAAAPLPDAAVPAPDASPPPAPDAAAALPHALAPRPFIVPPPASPEPPEPDPYAGHAARIAGGLTLVAISGVAGKVVAAPGVFVEAGLPPRGVLAPSLRLAFDQVVGAATRSAGGWLARFDRSRAALDATVVRLPVGPVDLAPFVAFGAGALAAEGHVGAAVVSRTRPWVDASVGGRARLWLFDRLSIEVAGGALFPFVRDTFAIDPTVTVDRTAAAAGFVGGGLSLRAW